MLCLNVLYTRPRRKFAKIDRRPGTCSVVCARNVTAGQVESAQFLYLKRLIQILLHRSRDERGICKRRKACEYWVHDSLFFGVPPPTLNLGRGRGDRFVSKVRRKISEKMIAMVPHTRKDYCAPVKGGRLALPDR